MTHRHVLSRSKIEYVSHCLNFREGCAHGCRYCYARIMKRQDYSTWRYGSRDVDFAVALLNNDVTGLRRRGEVPTGILVSSSHDPYPPGSNGLTRQLLEILAGEELPAWVLTKGGLRALDDMDLLQHDGARFGVTITTHDEKVREEYEPGAACTHKRMLALINAHLRGIFTWVSVEPPLPGLDIERLVEQCQGWLDWAVIGKLNYVKDGHRDWIAFREEAEEAFNLAGIPYLIKSELTEM